MGGWVNCGEDSGTGRWRRRGGRGGGGRGMEEGSERRWRRRDGKGGVKDEKEHFL